MDLLIITGIALALMLNFVNGVNDASHSIATVVETRALSPLKASVSSAIANFIGPFMFTTAVAATIGTELVVPGAMTPLSLVVAMLVSIMLILAATHIGLPVSSSHALIGGILGTGVAVAGLSALILPPAATIRALVLFSLTGAGIGALILSILAYYLEEGIRPALVLGVIFGISVTIPLMILAGLLVLSGILAIVVFIFISPVIGFIAAFLFDLLVSHLFRFSRQNRMRRIFQPLQVAASLFQAAGHGANDGQHAVGVICALLLAGGLIPLFTVPLWVIILSAAAIALGTSFGGWKVINKLAKEITKIRPYQGFCAATSGGAVLAMVTTYGIPVSSTQVMSGSIVGVGATRGVKAVKWEVTRRMMEAWVVTIPLAFALSWSAYVVLSWFL
ncbi:MAG TPA: inorganic phosphate transporter [Methanoregulaceae archaeon]|jgi:PiT family inorganic phosphate transporter|nr:inorganic phosphate transporter [Burkholderiaceae bacterium]NLH25181.1 inorganic phosphate transporter [Methanomicrobiales archaeon]HNI42007.1 inorganic phosphate transporter [Methanoregulaceae archaeon]HNL86192.1 inorganic phosphate transporter [Methanoregulaceae archaeon]HNW80732.1 inorganic phosphate transporter [Methanoregulaceae archaeon]